MSVTVNNSQSKDTKMDTIETSEPVGAVDIPATPDTSTNDTQPVETSEGSAPAKEEAGTASETLLAGKYKSAEELEKAYTELQSKFGEVGQKAELANLLEKQTGMNAQEIKDYIARQEQAQLEQMIQDNPGGYALQEIQGLKAQLALKEEEAALGDFITKNPEYAPFRDKILNLGLNLERDKSYEEIATEYFGQARAQGQQDAYRKIDTKMTTQTSGSQSAEPARKVSAEDLKNMSTTEMEAYLPKAESR